MPAGPRPQTLLSCHSVTQQTAAVYSQLLAEFDQILEQQQLRPVTPNQWDDVLARHLDSLFLAAGSRDMATKLVAAVIWRNPALSRASGTRLVLTRQALRGWLRLEPAGSRLPLPYCVICALVMLFLNDGRRDLALLVLFSVEIYARPAEPLRLRVADFVPPRRGGSRSLRQASVVMHPLELGKPAKNLEFDETLLFDLPRHGPLVKAMTDFVKDRPADDMLFKVDPVEFATALSNAEVRLGLEPLGHLHPYRFRHTGASHDFLEKERDLQAIQRRGRWRDVRSIRRYEKGGRVGQLFARLPEKLRLHAERCERLVPEVLRGRRSASLAPWPSPSSSTSSAAKAGSRKRSRT